MSSTRDFYRIAAIALTLLFGANCFIHRSAKNTPARLLVRSLSQSSRHEVLALGNSTMAAGFDPETFDRAWAAHTSPVSSKNIALGATFPVEHFLLGRLALQTTQNPRILIYGFFDNMLTKPTPAELSELSGNRSVAFTIDASQAAKYLRENAFQRAIFCAAACFPMFVERGNIWAKVERFRRQIGAAGLPREQSNAFGRVADFGNLDVVATDNFSEFKKTCRAAVEQKAPITPALDALFAQAAHQNVKIYAVVMPVPEGHRRQAYQTREWSIYLTYLSARLADYQGELIDSSTWISQAERFVDIVHSNPEGAREFSRQLGDELARREKQKIAPVFPTSSAFRGGE